MLIGTKNENILEMRGILMLQGVVIKCCSSSRLHAVERKASHHQPDGETQRWSATSGKYCLGRDDEFLGNDPRKSG